MEAETEANDVSINKEDEGNSVTMVDVLKEQEAFEEDATAVLGASDDKNCTYALGYVKRQALYACMTCCPDSVADPSTRAGMCLACSLVCHESHDLVELYTKRNFRCDCGTPKFPDRPCNFNADKGEPNVHNGYNQNFAGLYCVCHRPYPDPESNDDDEMIQCIVCEDWLHSKHLNSKVPLADQYSEMICQACMTSNDFLNNYMCFNVKADNRLNESNVSVDMNETDKSVAEVDTQIEVERPDPAVEESSSKIDSNMDEPILPKEQSNHESVSKDSQLESTDPSAESDKMSSTLETDEREEKSSETEVKEVNETEARLTETNSAAADTPSLKVDNEISDIISSDEISIDKPIDTANLTSDERESAAETLQDDKIDSAKELETEIEESTLNEAKAAEEASQDGEIDSVKDVEAETPPSDSIESTPVPDSVAEEQRELSDNIELTENKSEAVAESEDSTEIQKPISTDDAPVENNDEPIDECEGEPKMPSDNIESAPETLSEPEKPVDPSDETGTLPEVDNSAAAERSDSNETDVTAAPEENRIINESTGMDVDGKDDSIQNLTDTAPAVETTASTIETLENNIEMDQPPPTAGTENSECLDNESSNPPVDISTAEAAENIPSVSPDEKNHKSENNETTDEGDAQSKGNDAVQISENMEEDTECTVDAAKQVSETMEEDAECKVDNAEQTSEDIKMDADAMEVDSTDNDFGKLSAENSTPLESENGIDGKDKSDPSEIPVTLTNGEAAEGHENSSEVHIGKKRKFDDEVGETNVENAKKKNSESGDAAPMKCIKPPDERRIQHHGAVFWPDDWRRKLCSCLTCAATYQEKKVSFLLDTEDTVTAYEDLGKIKNSSSSQYEKGLEALSSLGHVQQINAITEYNKMKEKLNEFLTKFKNTNKVVKEEDIKSFFAGMKPKREPDGVYFCH